MAPVEKKTSIIGYVDNLNPVITKVEEFYTLNSFLSLFETASGCKFHRDPSSQKCKITPLGEWKQWLTQETVPLPFLLVSDNLEIRGVEIFESWSKTRHMAGDKLKQKINKFYSVERKLRHLYSFNSCILYTWVSLEALNNLYKLPLHTPNSQSLWVDL